MLLSFDIDAIHTLASLATTTSGEIENCYTTLMKVVEHNDWNCAERDMINDAIEKMKKDASLLSEQSLQYSDVLNKAALEFALLDESVPNLVQDFDLAIGQSTSLLPPTDRLSPMTSESVKHIRDTAIINDSFMAFEVSSAAENLSMCSFDSFLME